MSIVLFHAPTRIIQSNNCAKSLAEVLRHEKPKNLAILVDRNLLPLRNIQEIVRSSDHFSSCATVVEIDAREPDTVFVDDQISRFRASRPDLVVGIGGGITIDLA
ncbi:MAG: iron-containing alcohol dehydrogenase, partial [Gemmatimonadetes bacterium]|nr:iron-containing alcohol dehydrogenase [Gemmatimonadota bacterium]